MPREGRPRRRRMAAAALDEHSTCASCGPTARASVVSRPASRHTRERPRRRAGRARFRAQILSIRLWRRHMAACSRPIGTRLSPESWFFTSSRDGDDDAHAVLIAWPRVSAVRFRSRSPR